MEQRRSSDGKVSTMSSLSSRDQLTGENRSSWRRSFDTESDSGQSSRERGERMEQVQATEYHSPLVFVESLVVRPDMTFKILIVGNPYVGKSCFLMRLCTGTFTARYASTIGVDFYSRLIRYNDQIISLQLWDTAGQERFQSVTRAYYRGAQGVILMYDISSEDSFIAVKSWINSIRENMQGLPPALLLVGNKVDLDDYGRREVPQDTGETFAKMYDADFIETSAKTGYNVGHACLSLVNLLVTDCKDQSTVSQGRVTPMEKQQKPSCC